MIFCSRTQSQLVQFVNELKKVVGSRGIVATTTGHDGSTSTVTISVVSFGSRKHTCINPDVNQLGSVAAMNEKCLDLLQKRSATAATKKARRNVDENVATRKGKKGSGCEFYSQDDDGVRSLRDVILTKVIDLEEVVEVGKGHKVCPYYATRMALESQRGQFIVLPYSALLHRPTRESLGIVLNKKWSAKPALNFFGWF